MKYLPWDDNVSKYKGMNTSIHSSAAVQCSVMVFLLTKGKYM